MSEKNEEKTIDISTNTHVHKHIKFCQGMDEQSKANSTQKRIELYLSVSDAVTVTM